MNRGLVEAAAAGVPWDELRVMGGTAGHVPAAIRGLVEADCDEASDRFYWSLENNVVVQGQLFEAAVPTVPLIFAGLLEEPGRCARIQLKELLFWIVSGESHHEEVAAGRPYLGDECREAARAGLWLLYRELLVREARGELEGVYELLDILEPDMARLERLSKQSALQGPADPQRKRT